LAEVVEKSMGSDKCTNGRGGLKTRSRRGDLIEFVVATERVKPSGRARAGQGRTEQGRAGPVPELEPGSGRGRDNN